MEDIYKMNPLLSCPEDVVRVGNVNVSAAFTSELHLGPVANNYLQLEVPEPDTTGSGISDRLIKNQIANHPLYPDLVSAYIECQKVRAIHCYYLTTHTFFSFLFMNLINVFIVVRVCLFVCQFILSSNKICD